MNGFMHMYSGASSILPMRGALDCELSDVLSELLDLEIVCLFLEFRGRPLVFIP